MASVTLAESAKLSQDLLVAGVIENIVTVNPIYEVMPFDEIYGNALKYNRENVLGAVQFGTVGTTISAGKAAATFTEVTSSLTRILGDAEVDGLIQVTRSDIQDQKAIQVASKAKSVGRQFQDTMINGDGTSDTFEGLLSLVAGSQSIIQDTSGVTTNGGALTFEKIDELIDLVKDKDGEVDYLMMHGRTVRSYYSLLRALGGASIGEVIQLPSGRQVPSYRGIPIFRNDYLPTDQTQGSATTCTTVLAGTVDDGSRKYGMAGLTADGSAGIRVEEVGVAETKDETITRVKFYCGLALFSELGLAALTGVTN